MIYRELFIGRECSWVIVGGLEVCWKRWAITIAWLNVEEDVCRLTLGKWNR